MKQKSSQFQMQLISSIEVSLFSKLIAAHIDEVVSICHQFTNSIAGSNRDLAFAIIYDEQFPLPLYRGIVDRALEKASLKWTGDV
jgi:hypothetical protein